MKKTDMTWALALAAVLAAPGLVTAQPGTGGTSAPGTGDTGGVQSGTEGTTTGSGQTDRTGSQTQGVSGGTESDSYEGTAVRRSSSTRVTGEEDRLEREGGKGRSAPDAGQMTTPAEEPSPAPSNRDAIPGGQR